MVTTLRNEKRWIFELETLKSIEEVLSELKDMVEQTEKKVSYIQRNLGFNYVKKRKSLDYPKQERQYKLQRVETDDETEQFEYSEECSTSETLETEELPKNPLFDKCMNQQVYLKGYNHYNSVDRERSNFVFAYVMDIICQHYLKFNGDNPAFLQLEMLRRAFPKALFNCQHLGKLEIMVSDNDYPIGTRNDLNTDERLACLKNMLIIEMVSYRNRKLVEYIYNDKETITAFCHRSIGMIGWADFYSDIKLFSKDDLLEAVLGAIFGGRLDFLSKYAFLKGKPWFIPEKNDWRRMKEELKNIPYFWPLNPEDYGPDLSAVCQNYNYSSDGQQYCKSVKKYVYRDSFRNNVLCK